MGGPDGVADTPRTGPGCGRVTRVGRPETPDTARPFSPSQDPNNAKPATDPTAIQTLPVEGSSGQ